MGKQNHATLCISDKAEEGIFSQRSMETKISKKVSLQF
jgi:hypothetical protein